MVLYPTAILLFNENAGIQREVLNTEGDGHLC